MIKMYYLFQGKDATFKKFSLSVSLLLISFISYAQGGNATFMACNDLVQVSLDNQCEAQINPDMILEGTYQYPWSAFSVRISGVVGDIVTRPGSYSVTVTHTASNNNCWGNIKVEDKLPPIVENCPCAEGNSDPECQFFCSDEDAILNGSIFSPQPLVHENCGTYTISTTDQLINNGCDGKVLIRSWKYTDSYGNTNNQCKTYYYLAPVTLDDIVPPTVHVALPCGTSTAMQDIYNYFRPKVGATQALINAYPTINGQIINNQGLCNVIATKTDITSNVCGDNCPKSKKLIRSWSVIDWCANVDTQFVQIISTKDSIAPTIAVGDITANVNPWNCEARIEFPIPTTLHDNCDDSVTYQVLGPVGVYITYDAVAKKYIGQNVPKGIHQFFYKASDCCGNMGIDTVKVTVYDKSSPVAISKEHIVVSLTKENGNDGIAKVYPQSIDNGSHDGCTNIHLEIRREEGLCGHTGNVTYNNDGHTYDSPSDPDEGNFVKFCCEDLTDVSADGTPFGRVKVWLRVWDDGDMDGKFGSAGDNFNETWTWVRVEDKLPPSITCPADRTIECYEDPYDITKVGEAVAAYTCRLADVSYDDTDILSDCGFGTILRKWKIDSYPNTNCTQRITIKEGNLFDPSTINWPADLTTDCQDMPQFNVTWADAPCSLLGLSVRSDTFQFVEGVCLKIINRYTLVDWCQYDPNNGQTGGIWTHLQVVKIVDTQGPTVTCQDEMFIANDYSDSDNDGITCEKKGFVATASATDEGNCSTRYIKWVVFVDLWSDGVSDYEFSSFIPSNDINFDDDNNNGIPDIYMPISISGDIVSIEVPIDIPGSMSNHKITWKASDGCGNFKTCTSNVMVVDKKKPTPYCISLSTAVMDDGTVTLWARDFDKGSFDNCTAADDLLFTFDNAAPVTSKINQVHYFKGNGLDATKAEFDLGLAQEWNPDFNSSSYVFTCDDLPEADIQMTVWDEKGENDFCMVNLTLVDNQGACDTSTTRVGISGKIIDNTGQKMANVTVKLHNSALPDYPKTDITSATGEYAFNNAPALLNYTIEVEKNNDFLNGVSTLDLVMIQRHLLGIQLLNDPYKVIAGDINNDGKIRTSDLVELRKAILGINDAFGNNTSWKFVDSDHVFANANNPWPVDFVMNMSQVSSSKLDVDFKGIKVGDVNNSAKSNLIEDVNKNRSPKIVKLFVLDKDVIAGESFEVIVQSSKPYSLYGLQFSLFMDGLSLHDMSSTYFDVNDAYFPVSDQITNVSLANSDLMSLGEGADLLRLVLKAHKSGSLSDMLDLTSSSIKAEAYDEAFEVNQMQLVFKQDQLVVNNAFKAWQNEPNPFGDVTYISFSIPSTGAVQMTISDVSGKLIWEHTQMYQAGTHKMELLKDIFPLGGIYFITIQNNDVTSTFKMIHLK